MVFYHNISVLKWAEIFGVAVYITGVSDTGGALYESAVNIKAQINTKSIVILVVFYRVVGTGSPGSIFQSYTMY